MIFPLSLPRRWLLPAFLALSLSLSAADTKPLKDLYQGILIGNTATYGGLSYEGVFNSPTRDTFLALLQKEFSLAQTTCYPAWDTWTGVKAYDFSKVNQTVNWLRDHQFPVAMHLLGGPNNYYPAWFATQTFTNAQLEDMLEDFIRVAMTSNDNADKITWWNVVNECIDTSTTYYSTNSKCTWQQLGFEEDKSGLTGANQVVTQHPVWIRKAFEYAKKYSKPGNKLELRDFNIEIWDRYKSKLFYQLVKHLLNSGAPLDAVGMQGHFSLSDSTLDFSRMTRAIQEYKKLGLEVYVTELDVGDTAKAWTPEKAQLQKTIYQNVVQAAKAGGVEWICLWGMHDQGALYWRYDEMPLLFDQNYAPKPAYDGFRQGLAPTTPTEAPALVAQPASLTVAPGGSVTLSCVARGQLPLTYEWKRNGVTVSGATAATLPLSAVDSSAAGDYTVTVSNAGGAVTSRFARLTVASEEPGRIVNMSVRGTAGVGGQPLIVGFVTDGAQAKRMLVRGAGPTLSAFQVSGALADPRLEVFDGQTSVGVNDDWGSANLESIRALSSAAGAFAFASDTSKDAATVTDVVGARTVHVNGKNGSSGVVVVEAYETASAETSRLINVSARNQCGTGEEVLIAGFVINGNVPRRVLVRGIGPSLGAFGVTGALADPQLEVNTQVGANNVLYATNDDWSLQSNVAEIEAVTGPFRLNRGSKDSALLLTLTPGLYTAVVRGVANSTGQALVEVYEVP